MATRDIHVARARLLKALVDLDSQIRAAARADPTTDPVAAEALALALREHSLAIRAGNLTGWPSTPGSSPALHSTGTAPGSPTLSQGCHRGSSAAGKTPSKEAVARSPLPECLPCLLLHGVPLPCLRLAAVLGAERCPKINTRSAQVETRRDTGKGQGVSEECFRKPR